MLFTPKYTIDLNPRKHISIYLKKQKTRSLILLFLGSSRVASHIDTELFKQLSNKNVINFGVEGISLNDNLLQLKLLLNNNISISQLFLQIDHEFNFETSSIVMTTEAMPFLYNEIIKFSF